MANVVKKIIGGPITLGNVAKTAIGFAVPGAGAALTLGNLAKAAAPMILGQMFSSGTHYPGAPYSPQAIALMTRLAQQKAAEAARGFTAEAAAHAGSAGTLNSGMYDQVLGAGLGKISAGLGADILNLNAGALTENAKWAADAWKAKNAYQQQTADALGKIWALWNASKNKTTGSDARPQGYGDSSQPLGYDGGDYPWLYGNDTATQRWLNSKQNQFNWLGAW